MPDELRSLATEIKALGRELGFEKVGVSGVDLAEDERRLEQWLAANRNGAMHYMRSHQTKRSRPDLLVPGTIRVIAARMSYWPPDGARAHAVLGDANLGYVARYALGRDYHKVMRGRLRALARAIEAKIGEFG
jgi:epoxyqueuosine reductase